MVMSNELVVVMITAPGDQAKSLARAMVEQRLAACVNVLAGAFSVYRSEGMLEEKDESVLLVKTRTGAVPALIELMEQLHPDKNFELVTLTVESTSLPYLNWLIDSVEVPEEEREWFMH